MTPPAGSRAVLSGVGRALPAPMDQASLWTDFFRAHYRDEPVARRIFANSGITTRHGAVDPRVEDLSRWSTGARMERYVSEALPLGKEAVSDGLAVAGLDPGEVGLFAVASCTGYATPGLDIRLATDLGMPDTVQRLVIGHMGCYAAIPGLGAIADFVAARSQPAVLLCVELTSLHVQPATDDPQQVVAHALFGDAAAAVVLQPDAPAGWGLIDLVAVTDPTAADLMTWDVTDLGFRMGLSPRVPDVLARHVRTTVRDRLLAPHGLAPADVACWAIHPGGKRILEVVGEQLALPEAALRPSYEVLDTCGNCSSATVLLVMSRLPVTNGPAVAMAFGPGLTLYAALLRGQSW